MSDVEFDSDLASRGSIRPPGSYGSFSPANERGLTGWFIRHGMAKNTRMATVIFIAIVIVNVIIMYWAWHSGTKSTASGGPARTDVQVQDEMTGHYVNSLYNARATK